MGLIEYDWHFEIAPAPIVIKSLEPKGKKEKFTLVWGKYENQKPFTGFRYPKVGEVVEVPDFGKCKVERIIPLTGSKISRNTILRIIISWKSIGNKSWWDTHINYPAKLYWQGMKLTENDRKIFKDLDIPDAKTIKIKKEIANKVWYWGENYNSKFDSTAW
jgi:hypothetical protein